MGATGATAATALKELEVLEVLEELEEMKKLKGLEALSAAAALLGCTVTVTWLVAVTVTVARPQAPGSDPLPTASSSRDSDDAEDWAA